MSNLFTQHPHSIGETYFEHVSTASLYGLKMVLSGLACVIHAIFPFLFQSTASDCVKEMYQHMNERLAKSRP